VSQRLKQVHGIGHLHFWFGGVGHVVVLMLGMGAESGG